MKYHLSIMAGAAVAILLSGCSTQPKNISGSFVSPEKYSDQDCGDIERDYDMVSSRLEDLENRQSSAAGGDVVVTTIGLVLFWPALLALPFGPDHEEEIADLKGERAALSHAAHANDCENVDDVHSLPDSDAESSNGGS